MRSALVSLLLLGLVSSQKVYEGESKVTLQSYGLEAYADIKNLENLAVAYFNQMCRDHGRSDGCFKYVDIYGQRDSKWPQRKVEILDI